MRILVVGSERRATRFISRMLSENGYEARACALKDGALERLPANAIALVVLDLGDGDGDAVALCSRLRQARPEASLIVLSPRGSVDERVEALRAGADDHLVKPYEVDELLARVRALMRRAGETIPTLRFGDLKLDGSINWVTVESRSLNLTARELRIVKLLARRPLEVVAREELVAELWPAGAAPGAMDVQICRLRRKLGDHSWMIETVRGRGYRLRKEREMRL